MVTWLTEDMNQICGPQKFCLSSRVSNAQEVNTDFELSVTFLLMENFVRFQLKNRFQIQTLSDNVKNLIDNDLNSVITRDNQLRLESQISS